MTYHRLLLLLATTTALWPQVPRAPRAVPNYEPYSIRGQVLDTVTGRAVSGARVCLRMSGPTAGSAEIRAAVLTDAAGSFVISNIPWRPGTLWVERSGYLGGEHSSPEDGVVVRLPLRRDRAAQGMTFRLRPHAVLVGTIRDQHGAPVAHARVYLLRPRELNGGRNWEIAHRVAASRVGEYRLSRIPAGMYLFAANALPEVGQNPRDASQAFVPAYLPETPTGTPRRTIALQAGEQQSLDATLTRVPASSLHCRVTNPHPTLTASLVPDLPLGPVGLETGSKLKVDASSGLLHAKALPLGTYKVHAEAVLDWRVKTAATAHITVGGTMTEDCTLTLTPLPRVEAEFRFQGAPPVAASSSVGLESAQLVGNPRQHYLRQQGGALREDNLAPGRYRVRAWAGLGWYLQEMLLNGRSTAADNLVIDPGATGTLRVELVMAKGGSRVTGMMKNLPEDHEVFHVGLFRSHDGVGFREQVGTVVSQRRFTGRAESEYQLSNVPPGNYYLCAWGQNMELFYAERDGWDWITRRCPQVQVGPDTTVRQDVSVLPQEP